MLSPNLPTEPEAEPGTPEAWRDAKLVSKEAARILCENRSLSWYEALRRARISLGYRAEVGS